MGFLEDLIKHFVKIAAVEASKDAKGKPDPYKAAGIYAGLHGDMSLDDMASLGSLLGAQGAFDDTPSEASFVAAELGIDPDDYDSEEDLLEAIEEAKYAWRDEAEPAFEYGLNPVDFETREEYEEALEQAKYGWRDEAEDAFEYGLDPADYETQEEYEEAVEQAKYGWRTEVDDGFEYGLDPEDYETQEEYEEALNYSKYEWRNTCIDCSEYGVDPQMYETEEEYGVALAQALELLKSSSGSAEGTNTEEPDDDDELRVSDYPTRRKYEAAYERAGILNHTMIYADEKNRSATLARCNFILESENCLAANYLTVECGFLCAQAIKEHFSLPCSFPDEDEEPVTWLEDAIKLISKHDVSLAIAAWHWCLVEFIPYIHYASPNEAAILNDILNSIYRYPKSFVPELIKYADAHTDFIDLLIRQNTEVPEELEGIIVTALQMEKTNVAQAIFDAFQLNDHVTGKDIAKLIELCLGECQNWDEINTISVFRDTLYASIRNAADPNLSCHFKGWDEEIRKYIEETTDYIQ